MKNIKFITWDEATDGIAVEHDGRQVWADGSHDSWGQYFRQYMPTGTPVVLSQDTRPSEHEGQAEAPAPSEFSDQFTVFPDGATTGLHCHKCAAAGRRPYRGTGYHPSLDVLIEKAREHNQAEHGPAGGA